MSNSDGPESRSFFDRLAEPFADKAREKLNQAEDKVRAAIQAEVDAVQASLRARAVEIRPSAIAFGAAVLLTFFGLALLVAASVLGLVAGGMDPWLSALLIGVALILIGGGIAAWGKHRLPKPAPQTEPVTHPAGDQVHPWDN
ncbi:phage holin family protein [Cellulomonas edaphi]|uniref:Phage holin family protein n=1 Tax=Cellulomonas edaphi TaxID=3053468 RepID=A0ABT7S9S6_9CELL|nr:phage holin family protein [Cellulomons edaphi]MDM7832362.1 phage holin family protein [Cellulomons edaphi]